jgi:hypothetical protein
VAQKQNHPKIAVPLLSADSRPSAEMLFQVTSAALGYQLAMPTGHAAVVSRGIGPMMMADRTPLMAGNWKMNTDLNTAVALAKDVAASAAKASDVDVAVCVPFPFLIPVKEALAGSTVGVGAQDCHWEEAGAYTGASNALLAQKSRFAAPSSQSWRCAA